MIQITEEARRYIIAMLERSGKPAVKLGLEEQGCNGYKYVWEPVGTNLADHSIELDPDHYIVLNSDDYAYFANSTVVLEISRFDKKLGIINPNVDSSCGCGESVNFK
jgi:iron-sulfur cluster assembly protein